MGKGLLPRLRITAPTGSTVTASWQSKTVTLKEVEEGVFEADVPALAPWEVTATLNEDSKTAVVNVTDVARFEKGIDYIPEILNDVTWEQISQVSSNGVGDTYWDIGDAKAVTLNGTVGICTFSNETYYAFIIGFNHNSTLEGDNRIHFQFGKTALSDGTDVCFIDSSFNSVVSATGYFSMNSSNTNVGGWSSSQMRNTICGTSLSSYSGTFIAALPSDLRSVLKTVTKYTDNAGNSSTSAANVTATTDVIFLLAEYEVFGTIALANTNESAKQAQYAYYSAGNSKVKYRHTRTGTAALWWLRSPSSSSSSAFVHVNTSDTVSHSGASISYGFAPGFCV